MRNSSPSSITPEVAATQLLQRRRARASLEAYLDYSDLGFRPAFHHKLLLTHLEALERGDFDRLMVMMPPGSAKSTYTSVVFPIWYIGRHPENSVIGASHTQDLADRSGRGLRNLASSRSRRAVFGVGVAADRQAAGQ